MTERRRRTLRKVGWVYFFMQHYKINSPSGKRYYVAAESIYHAVQIAKKIDNFLFTEADYFKINTVKR